MKTRKLALLALLASLAVAGAPRAALADRGSYATVNGLKMYYEAQGSGRPLVLLHGALTTIDSSFGVLRPALAAKSKTIAIELQGHGRTADRDAPLTVEQMVDDTAALLRKLGIREADVFGYSMGGAVALRLAIRHPALVRKLVVLSMGFSDDGFQPGFLDMLRKLKPEDLPRELRDEYAAVAPNPKGWTTWPARWSGCSTRRSGARS